MLVLEVLDIGTECEVVSIDDIGVSLMMIPSMRNLGGQLCC